MRSRFLIFIFVVVTGVFLIIKNREIFYGVMFELYTQKASHNCRSWIPQPLWALLNSENIPYMRSETDNSYIHIDYERELMLSQSETHSMVSWFNGSNLYTLTDKSFRYSQIEKKYARKDISFLLRVQLAPPTGHWHFRKGSDGIWVGSISVYSKNALYDKQIKCDEVQGCTWQNHNYDKLPLDNNLELIQTLQRESFLSSSEYEKIEDFCKRIEQKLTQEKLRSFENNFENQCSLDVNILEHGELQRLCSSLRNFFIPTFKKLEASILVENSADTN